MWLRREGFELSMENILITVAMPCFNDAGTLPRALASLVAQTHTNWECVLVDDGSTDDVKSVVDALGDPRVVYFRFEENRGRGAARQQTLEMARGEFFCMLDADDWYYPEKLERQLAVMVENPELALVSVGVATVDAGNQLSGVRAYSRDGMLQKRCLSAIGNVEFMFATAMIRGSVAQATSFDESLMRSEDLDYLWEILDGKIYGFMPTIGYSYQEISSMARLYETLARFRTRQSILKKYARKYPLQVVKRSLQAYAKGMVYKACMAVGRGQFLIERRNVEASVGEVRSFEVAREVVDNECERLFGNM